MPGKLMTSLFQNLLEAVSSILQAALQRSGADAKLAGDLLYFGATPRKPLLNGAPNALRKTLLPFMLLQLIVQPGSKHLQKLGIVSNESQIHIGCTEEDFVSR